MNIFYPDERQRKFIPYRSKKELTGEIRLVDSRERTFVPAVAYMSLTPARSDSLRYFPAKSSGMVSAWKCFPAKRALDYLSGSTEQNSQIAVSLSVKENETKEAVQRLLDEVYDLKGQLAQEKQKSFEAKQLPLLGKAMYSSSRIQWKQQKSESAPIPF